MHALLIFPWPPMDACGIHAILPRPQGRRLPRIQIKLEITLSLIQFTPLRRHLINKYYNVLQAIVDVNYTGHSP